MASGSIALSTNSTNLVTGAINWYSTTYPSENYSLVNVSIVVYMRGYGIQGTGSGTWDENGSLAKTFAPYCNVPYGGSGDAIVFTKNDIRVNHDSNGNGQITFGTWMDFPFAGVYGLTGSGIAYMDHINRYPNIDLSKISNTATTIKVRASVNNGISASKYKFNGNETTNNEYEFTNLNADTSYTIRAQAYGNGGWGNEASIIVRTNSKSTITEIGDFTINGVEMSISGDSKDKSNIVVLIDGEEVIRRDNIFSGEYELILTEKEKEKIYELMGNNNSIEAVVRIESGGDKTDIEKDITLTGDVFSCVVNVNGVNKRGKVWVGTAQGNKQGIFTVGTSNGNVRGR